MFILSYKSESGDVVTRACGDVQVNIYLYIVSLLKDFDHIKC